LLYGNDSRTFGRNILGRKFWQFPLDSLRLARRLSIDGNILKASRVRLRTMLGKE
jgi:hypothetical protein